MNGVVANKKIIVAFLVGIFGISLLTFGLLGQKKKTTKRVPLTFQKQFIGPFAYTGEVPGVLKASFGNDAEQGIVEIGREKAKLTFLLPIAQSSIVAEGGFFNPTGVQFSTPEKTIEVKYSLVDTGLKEEIVLNKIPKENTFPSTLKTEGLVIKLSSEGIPVFYDTNNVYQFHFERPYVKDAAGTVSYGVKYRIAKENGKEQTQPLETEKGVTKQKLLTESFSVNPQDGKPHTNIFVVEIDPDWLHDPKRVLPITIDPTVVRNTTAQFATGTFNRTTDAGSGASPSLESYYQELASDQYTVGLWHMNEASGNVLDSSGNGNTGTPTGTTAVTGRMGNARSFNGSSDSISMGTPSNLIDITQAITLEAWIKRGAPATVGHIVGAYGTPNSGYNLTFGVGDANNDKICFTIQGVSNYCTSKTYPDITQWHHIAVTYDRSIINIYVDGVIVETFPQTVALTVSASGTFQIGRRAFGGYAPFNGVIDEVRVSNIARTTEEIKLAASRRSYGIYTSSIIDFNIPIITWNALSWTELGARTGDGETVASSSGLVAQWNFNETSGTIAANSAGACGVGCNGALTSFANTSGQDVVATSGWTANNKRWGAGALMYNGLSTYVNIGNNTSLQGLSSLSVESWINANSFSTNWGIVNKHRGGFINGTWTLRDGSTDLSKILFITYGASCTSHTIYINGKLEGAGATQAVSTQPLKVGTWYHVVATASGCSGLGTNSYNAGIGYLELNNAAGVPSLFFNGTIDSTRIYSRALSASEVLSNYNVGNVKLQTRVGATANPDDGTWEDWKPATSEAQIANMDSDSTNWALMALVDGTQTNPGTSCTDILNKNPSATSGNYWIKPPGADTAFQVQCDMTTDGGGWTLVLNHPLTAGISAVTGWTTGNQVGTSADFTNNALKWKLSDAMINTMKAYGYRGTGSYGTCYGGTCSGSRTFYWRGSCFLSMTSAATGACSKAFDDYTFKSSLGTTDAVASHRGLCANNYTTAVYGGCIGHSGDYIWSGPFTVSQVHAFTGRANEQSGWQIWVKDKTPNKLVTLSNDTATKAEGTGSLKIQTGITQADSDTVGLWHLEETSGQAVTKIPDGTTPGAAAKSCQSLKLNGFNTDGAYWIDPDGPNTGNAPSRAYCDMTNHGGGWTLAMNLQTSDGATRHYDDTTFWAGTTLYGSADSPFMADTKTTSFSQLAATDLMMEAHNDGSQMGTATYSLIGSATGKTLYWMFNNLANTTITGARVANTGAVGALGRGANAGEAFIDNPQAIIINSTYQPFDATNVTRLGTNYASSCSVIGCGGHSFGGWGGRHFRGGWGAYYEGAAINSYCSTQGGFGTNGYAYNGNNAFDGSTTGCGAETTKLRDVDMAVFTRNSTDTADASRVISDYLLKDSSGFSSLPTGGEISYSGGYTIHTFRSNGTFTPNRNMNVEVLVVGGGGGGGMDMGGGGGGGGVVSSNSYTVTANTPINATIGAGGAGGPAGQVNPPGAHQYTLSAKAGKNSVFGSLTALGGGYGGSSYQDYTPNNALGGAGSSGGGASGYTPSRVVAGGATLGGQGYKGGNSYGNGAYCAGGGGGAGGAGTNGTVPNGGPGVVNAILGTSYYWGGGGGGNNHNVGAPGNGGLGGGGGGTQYTGVGGTAGTGGYTVGQAGGTGASNAPGAPGGNGGVNTGGGGGGGTHYNNGNQGGDGGSGIVVVRYPTISSSTKTYTHIAPIGTTPINGVVGKGRRFVSGDVLTIPSNAATDITGSISVGLWFRRTGGHVPSLIGKGTNNNYSYRLLATNARSGPSTNNWLGGGITWGINSSYWNMQTNYIMCSTVYPATKDPCPDKWTHAVGTYDIGDNSVKLYVDGVLVSSGTASGPPLSNTAPVEIGLGRYDGNLFYFTGDMDEIFIKKYPMSAEEVAEMYRMGRDNQITKTFITPIDLSTKSSLPFSIAADRPGTYLSATLGKSAFANYEPDTSTVGLWHLDENASFPKSCSSLYASGVRTSGMYRVDPDGNGPLAPVQVYCDMVNDGGGWTLVLNSSTGSVTPPKPSWAQVVSSNTVTGTYGTNLDAFDQFLGVGYWNALGNQMRLMQGSNSNTIAHKATYSFSLNADNNYSIAMSNQNVLVNTGGTASSGMYDYSAANNFQLTTFDADHDVYGSNCANSYGNTAWWYGACWSGNFWGGGDGGGYQNAPFWTSSTSEYFSWGGIWIRDSNVTPDYSLKDSSGGNNGLIQGAISAQGKVGKARYFNGSTSDYIAINDNASLDITGNFTLSAWVNKTAATTAQVISKWAGASTGGYALLTGSTGEIYCRTDSGSGYVDSYSPYNQGLVSGSGWHHIAAVRSGSSCRVYIDGVDKTNAAAAHTTVAANSKNLTIGASAGNGEYFTGLIDEARVDAVARTPDEIRQAYEVGIRTHQVTIDFGADLDASNIITNASDLSFTVDATHYGLKAMGSNIYGGDKIIVRENSNGTEYVAQGSVSSVVVATGAITVSSWDVGSTFPSGGFSANASVFKWQKEYFDITGSLASHRNMVDRLTLRLTNGNEGRTVWLDDFRSAENYLTPPSGSAIFSSVGNRYFQYRSIFSSSDSLVSPALSSVTADYIVNIAPYTPALIAPVDTATGQDLTPIFTMSTTDYEGDYVQYKLQIATDVGFTQNVQTFDQTSSQTGWTNQDTQSGTAYLSGSQATYTAQSNLLFGTTYYVRVYATDLGGSLEWSVVSPTTSFTVKTINAPTNCYVTATSDTGPATIIWTDNSFFEDNYQVEQSINSGAYSVVDTVARNTTSSVQTVGLNTYQYRIRTIASNQYSPYCTTNPIVFPLGSMKFQGIKFNGIRVR